MDQFPTHERVPDGALDRTRTILTFAILILGVLLCASFSEPLNAKERGDLLLTLRTGSDQPIAAVMDAIRRRAAALGASMEEVVEIDPKTVSIRLPGYKQDVKKAVRIMERRALLEFKLVDDKADVAAAEKGDVPPGDEILYKVDRNPNTGAITRKPYVTKKRTLMTGEVITDARVQTGYTGTPVIAIRFNSTGAREFERMTGEHINEQLAIVLDDRLYSAPVIRDRISGGSAVIEGRLTHEEAEELALVLRCGPIVAPVEVVKSEWLKPRSGSK